MLTKNTILPDSKPQSQALSYLAMSITATGGARRVASHIHRKKATSTSWLLLSTLSQSGRQSVKDKSHGLPAKSL